MKRKLSFSTVLVVCLAIAMVTSPVAMATGATAGVSGDERPSAIDETDLEADGADLEVDEDEIRTQSGDDVEVADELRAQLRGDGTVEVFVRLDAAESEIYAAATDDEPTGGSQAALEREAAISQAGLIEHAARSDGVDVLNEFWLTNAVLLEVDADGAAVDQLRRVDGVTELHPNYEVEMAEPESADGPATTFGLEQVNAPAVWDDFDVRGEGASVAVVDTGIDPDHQEFADRRDEIKENWRFFDLDGSEIESEPFDENDHGTHVAGTVVGGDESGDHIGVAPGAELIPINVFPDPGGATTIAAIVAGMEEAVEQGADVANFSLGGPGFAAVYIDVVRNARDAGTLIVTSAGNGGPGSQGTPANVYDSLAVGATDEDEQVAVFSTGDLVDTPADWGPIAPGDWPEEYATPDVAAPGVGVISSVAGGDDQYAAFSGTSMAAPHTTGVAALMFAADDDLEPADAKSVLEETATKPAIEEIGPDVVAHAEVIGDEQADLLAEDDERDARYGYGIVDAHAAVTALEASGTITGTVTDGDAPVEGATIDVTGDVTGVEPVETDDDGAFEIEAPVGTYELTATDFGLHGTEEGVDVTEGAEIDVGEIELDDVLAVETHDGLPIDVPANESVDVETTVANLETLTVDLGPGATVGEDEVDVTVDGEPVSLGEEIEFTEGGTLHSGDVTIGVETDASESNALELEYAFAGPGEDRTLADGPATVVAEGAEPQLEIAEFEPPEEILIPVPTSIEATIENAGDRTATETVYYSSVLGLSAVTLEEEVQLAPGESETLSFGPILFEGLSPTVNHQVGIGDEPMLVGGDPETESEVKTSELYFGPEIVGTVTDADTGDPISGATVTVTDEDGDVYETYRTTIDGEYFITPTELGEYDLHVDADGYTDDEGSATLEDFNDLEEREFELRSEPEYEFQLRAGEAYALGIPGPIAGDTLGDVLDSDAGGQIYAFDADEGQWTAATTSTPVGELEAFVVVPTEDTNASIEFAGEPGETDQATPTDREIVEGWNFVAPASFDTPEEALVTTEEVLSTTEFHAEPESTMVGQGTYEGLDDDGVMNPFSGYFVLAEDDGVQAGTTHEGLTHAGANEKLNVSTERIVGEVVGEHGGEPIPGIEVEVEDTPLRTVTTDDFGNGQFGINNLPAGAQQRISVEADGFADTTATVQAGAENTIEMQEDVFFEATSIAVAEDELSPGDEIEVTYEVTNLGFEASTQIVEVGFGWQADDPRGNFAVALDATEVELEPGESEEVTVTQELTEPLFDYPTLEVGVVTHDDASTVPIDEAAAFDVSLASVDDEVTQGEELTVDFLVENVGGVEDQQDVAFSVDGDEEDAIEGVGLAENEVLDDQFTYAATADDADAGEVTVAVETDDDAETETVTVVEADPDGEIEIVDEITAETDEFDVQTDGYEALAEGFVHVANEDTGESVGIDGVGETETTVATADLGGVTDGDAIVATLFAEEGGEAIAADERTVGAAGDSRSLSPLAPALG